MAAIVAMSAAGCVSAYRPAMTITVGHGAAAASDAGVRIVADTDEWRGDRIAVRLLPMQITVENGSPRPLRLRYQDVTLMLPGGRRLPALPPFDLRDKDPRIPSRYPYAWYAFRLAPYLTPFYRGFWTGGEAVPHDVDAFAARYRELSALTAPTAEMMRRALPEGVLAPGGYITGVLYFAISEAAGAMLRVPLVDAGTSERFGAVHIRLVTLPRGKRPAALSLRAPRQGLRVRC